MPRAAGHLDERRIYGGILPYEGFSLVRDPQSQTSSPKPWRQGGLATLDQAVRQPSL
jgi:hypothetical protein